MKILLVGKNGQVGQALQRALAPLGPVIAIGRTEADLERPEALRGVLLAHEFDVIVNAAAYTAVDKAESEPMLARAVNAESVAVLANYAAARGSWLVHYSTDYVFDGGGTSPWREDDSPAPLSVYGKTKLEGEMAIISSGARHLIFRTSWVHGSYGANFCRTMLRLARDRDTLNVVGDQIGAPTSADLIADVTAHALHQAMTIGASVSGLYHLAAAGETSWHSYARFAVAEASGLGMQLKARPEQIFPITTIDYPTPAHRPRNSRLDTGMLSRQFGLIMPPWQDGVRRTVRDIISEAR